MNIGKAIQKIRKSRGLSQTELSERSGMNRTYLSLIEGNRRLPSLDAMMNIASCLEVPMAALFVSAIEADDLPESTRANLPRIRSVVEQLLATLYDEAMIDAMSLLGKKPSKK